MKIDKAKLIELLVDKTGMDQPSVEEQLDQLIKRIVDAAERGKALEIKEFGLFYFNSDGDLKFDPSDELSTEINFKYAGMEPVEIKSARDSAPVEEEPVKHAKKESEKAKKSEPSKEISDQQADEESEQELDEIFGLDDSTAKSSDSENDFDEYEEPPSDEPIISKPHKVDRDIDPFSGLLGDASSKFGKKPEELPEEEGIDHSIFGLDDPEPESETEIFAESKPEPKEEKVEPAKPAESAKKTVKPQTSRDPITVVMSVVLVFVLVAAGFFMIPILFQQPVVPEVQQTVDEPVATDITETLTPVEPQEEVVVTEDEVNDEIEPEIEIEAQQSIYGLTGTLINAANDGFSIVLFSFANEERARAQATDLAGRDYRVLVSPRTVNQNTTWRVSVGQFPSISEAQEAATKLPSPYNSNNFIQRIQTN